MRRHPKAFDDLYVNMVAAGRGRRYPRHDPAASLDLHREGRQAAESQVRAAMIYPIAVITIAAIVVAVILLKVIPTFAALFTSLGAELPFPTRVVIAASNFLARYFIFIVIGIARGHLLLPALLPRPTGGRRVIDGIAAQGADHRHDPAQDRRRAVLPHARDADVLGRADPRRASTSPPGRPATRSSRTPSSSTRKSVEGGKTMVEPARRTRRSSRTWSCR